MAFTFSKSEEVKNHKAKLSQSKTSQTQTLQTKILNSQSSRAPLPQSSVLENTTKNSEKLSLLKIYYGSGQLEKLLNYKHVAIQSAYYSDSEIKMLKAGGALPLAYLSLGEDPKDFYDIDQPYRRKRMNTDWETHYVYVGSHEWQEKMQNLIDLYIKRGFQGFLLDSLDVIDLFPEDRSAMLQLINYIHQQLSKLERQNRIPTYLIANRGFSLLPEMASMIDANLFEGFSTRWSQNASTNSMSTEIMSTEDLNWSALKARELEQFNLDRYALDYCISENSAKLEHFAIARANYYGLTPLTSNRALTEI